MIELCQLSGKTFWLNPHQILYIERTPDTNLVMANGSRILVREPVPVVLERIIRYRRGIGVFNNEE